MLSLKFKAFKGFKVFKSLRVVSVVFAFSGTKVHNIYDTSAYMLTKYRKTSAFS